MIFLQLISLEQSEQIFKNFLLEFPGVSSLEVKK